LVWMCILLIPVPRSATSWTFEELGSIPGRSTRLFFLQNTQHSCWAHPTSYFVGTGPLSTVGSRKRLRMRGVTPSLSHMPLLSTNLYYWKENNETRFNHEDCLPELWPIYKCTDVSELLDSVIRVAEYCPKRRYSFAGLNAVKTVFVVFNVLTCESDFLKPS